MSYCDTAPPLVSLRTGVKNRVHSILLNGYPRTHTDLFGNGGAVPGSRDSLLARPSAGRLLAILDAQQEQIDVATEEIEILADDRPEAEALCRLPGIGRYSAMLILAEIGDVRRFPTAKHLVPYAGLAPSVRASGGTVRTDRITKQGSKWLR